MVFVLLALSILIFYLTRGLLPPTTSLAPYITPRMDDSAKLSLARALGVATSSCPSFASFTRYAPGCVVPIWEQYWAWLHNALSGNWGYSLLPDVAPLTPTWDTFFSRFPFTAELALAAAFFTVILGVPLGVISATHQNKLPDHLSRIVSLGGYSVPQFWFGAVLQIIFVLYIRIGGLGLLSTDSTVATTCALCFAKTGIVTAFTGMPVLDGILSLNPAYTWDSIVALILPALTLAITSIGAITRILRSSMMDVLRQDYITMARSKGLKERIVIYRHALRNAMLPTITVIGLLVSYLFGGAVIVEIVFSWPGVGNASLAAADALDVNFLELYVLVTAVIIVVVNLLVDVIYAKLDPRVRY
jgi:ABC-type dipeptide/oligopeptide/nickel transport system permease component